ncbi:MAG TPA: hypothetical protein VFP26_10930 [Gemmatimonadaceae bacterium]|jgi:hypothetical protein|nr:hypothetical protein [Gemmatimonadaceae bacterium]
MTANKDFKRLVRARMKKTGEAYTTARSRLVKKPKLNYATIAGMSDVVIKQKTGCTWEKWVKALDYHGAEKLRHAEIVGLVRKTYKVGDWWAQMVTVGYERIKGLRAKGQRRDGTYEASKSRTFEVPVSALFDAWANDVTRRSWLNGADVRVRTATKPKSMRLDWNKSIVAVGFASKGSSKSSVAVQHTKLPDRDAANQIKEYWSERLDALGELFTTRS